MIEEQVTKILYTADGTNKVWEIPFDYIDNADVALRVKLPTDADFSKITENYVINKAAATITYPASGNALVADSSVLIERNTPVTQLEDSTKLHFTSADIERGLDKITMIAQEIKNDTDEFSISIKTLRNDVDDLGDQVQGIEAKIPQSADSSNQLVDKETMAGAISNAVATKQDTLVAGANITIAGNVISATVSGGGTGGAVNSVNGKTGDVVLSASDVGAATTQYVDNAVAGAGGSGLTGVVVLNQTGLAKSARSDSQRVNIGTRTYKFITLELNSADGYWCSPMHSSAGYGNRSGNFATIKIELDAAEFTDNLIIKNGGDTFGYKVTLWY